jgi:hypothetical protein
MKADLASRFSVRSARNFIPEQSESYTVLAARFSAGRVRNFIPKQSESYTVSPSAAN